MNGEVDAAGRALLVLPITRPDSAEPVNLVVWVDTAFTGELVLPRAMIESLRLPQSAAVLARLADGQDVVLESHTCTVEWFGDARQVEVISNDGQFPLLGVGLLCDRKLQIDYRTREIQLD